MGEMGQPGSPGIPGPSVYGAAMQGWFQRAPVFKGPGYQGDEAKTQEKEDVFKALKDITEELRKLKFPDGSKEAPARTCQQIKKNKPDAEDGYYWVDPNAGVKLDAIRVYCDFRSKKIYTCVLPAMNITDEHTAPGSTQSPLWYASQHLQDGEIPYQSKVVQIKFLQSLHDKAEQEITFHCKNSVAYRDAQSKSKDRAILLTTFNGDWLGANNKKKFRYKVTEDGCQVKDGSWGKTVFEVKTKKTNRLPIVDVGIADIGQQDQAFRVEVGRVCFS